LLSNPSKRNIRNAILLSSSRFCPDPTAMEHGL
jgi:hypothetical protein